MPRLEHSAGQDMKDLTASKPRRWIFDARRWVNAVESQPQTIENPLSTMCESLRIFVRSCKRLAKLNAAGLESGMDLVNWDVEKSLLVIDTVERYGTSWSTIADRLFNPLLGASLIETITTETVSEDELKLSFIDFQVQGEPFQSRLIYCIKDWVFRLLREADDGSPQYEYSGAAEEQYMDSLARRFNADCIFNCAELRDFASRIFEIVHSEQSKPAEDGKAQIPYSEYRAELQKDGSIGLVPDPALDFYKLDDVMETLVGNKTVALASNLHTNCMDVFRNLIKINSRSVSITQQQKDHHSMIEQIIANTVAKWPTELAAFKLNDPSSQEFAEFFKSGTLSKPIYTYETFKAYAETLYECFLVFHLERQVKNANKQINQWSSKFNDLRKNLKIIKKKIIQKNQQK